MCLCCCWIVFQKVVSNRRTLHLRAPAGIDWQSRAIFEVGGVHRLHCTVPCLSFGQQLNALARWRGVPSAPSNSLFVSDKMAEVPGAGEPMEVVEEERSTEAGVGSSTEEGAGSAAEPALPPPPPPPPNPAQNPHPQLSITPVRKFSSLLQ